MGKIEAMTKAYIEAIFFTETGDNGQPEGAAELSALDKTKAYIECRNFFWGMEELLLDDKYDPAQVGHDIWLTRNGHGVGFWDRPKIYGEQEAKILTAMAKAMGPHEVSFEETV